MNFSKNVAVLCFSIFWSTAALATSPEYMMNRQEKLYAAGEYAEARNSTLVVLEGYGVIKKQPGFHVNKNISAKDAMKAGVLILKCLCREVVVIKNSVSAVEKESAIEQAVLLVQCSEQLVHAVEIKTKSLDNERDLILSKSLA